jgi:DNA-binding beta-propeller fold protein YncE
MSLGQARVLLVQVGAVLAAGALVAGCGNNYRPVVTPINPSGPAAQPSSFAVVVSAPSPSTSGIATIIDYSGDSVMAKAPVGIGPTTFTVDTSGTSGYTINSDHTMTNFPVSSKLQEKDVDDTTLPITANLVNVSSLSGGLWVADLDKNVVDLFTGAPETFLRSIPLAPTPVMIVGSTANSQRNFGISQGNSNGSVVSSDVACNLSPTTAPAGEADGIEVSNDSVSSRIALGQCPVYAVESNDGKRLFVLNRGSDTVSVINLQNNTLDSCTGLVNQAGQPVTCHPTLPLSLTAVNALNNAKAGSGNPPNGTSGMTNVAGPVYAEYSAANNQLVVANYDGGTISIIDVSLDEYGNDGPTFGTTFTVPVGSNPASVTVLNDGSRAYTANQADGTVTVVNLSSHTAVKTLAVTGYPRTVVSTQNSTQGKVYVASPNSPYLTIIRTDQDIVDTTVLVEGNIVDVRVSTQNAVGGNNNVTSRIPGHGQPCNLPPAAMTTKYTAIYTLANCQAQP